MGDPFVRMAPEWDRNDGLDDFYGETVQEMSERLGRLGRENVNKIKSRDIYIGLQAKV